MTSTNNQTAMIDDSNKGTSRRSDEETWNISIKQVNESAESFTIDVSPEDDISCLHRQIEKVTGLEPSQQRLIYRGRLIHAATTGANAKNRVVEDEPAAGPVESDSKGTNGVDSDNHGNAAAEDDEPVTTMRIKDITGLTDGHTIHLIQRKESNADASSPAGRTSADEESSTTATSNSMTGDFLAALLGMGRGAIVDADSEDNANESTNNNNTASPAALSRWTRTQPQLQASRRRFHHRLEPEDLNQPDPGSMESVRQGLLTLHTLLPAAEASSPLQVNRRWYMGQWIDCLDTVNQWLEATIIDVVDPDVILPPSLNGSAAPERTMYITSEQQRNEESTFVAASDLERRTQLLLEPCEEGDPQEEGGEWAGWKRRDNRGVQLLLVHYNGWPHRWDEWIRSDSDRIRPFRTRTRHANASPYACPTPQSTYTESPSTHIQSDVEMEDREALLPELGRVMQQVNSLLNRINDARAEPAFENDAFDESQQNNLPWVTAARNRSSNGEEEKEEERSAVRDEDRVEASEAADKKQDSLSARDLEVLGPLLDRLGRTLIDAAPHVMSLARATRDGGDDNELPPLEPAEEEAEHPTSLGGLLSLLSRGDRRRQQVSAESLTAAPSDNTSVAQAGSTTTSTTGVANDDVLVDPDHSDFSAGIVNTSRGEVRNGPRSRAQPNSDDAASFLGAYLASASLGGVGITGGESDGGLQGLGRLLSDRTGGIDIHIHAVVTAPGMPSGALGLAGLVNGGAGMTVASPGTGTEAAAPPETTGGGTFLSRNRSGNRASRSSSARRRMSPIFQNDGEDEMGIFSELYSENPEPVDPISPSSSMEHGENVDAGSNDEESEPPSPLPPHRIQSRRARHNSSRSLNNESWSNSASERGSQGRFFNRLFRRSNSES